MSPGHGENPTSGFPTLVIRLSALVLLLDRRRCLLRTKPKKRRPICAPAAADETQTDTLQRKVIVCSSPAAGDQIREQWQRSGSMPWSGLFEIQTPPPPSLIAPLRCMLGSSRVIAPFSRLPERSVEEREYELGWVVELTKKHRKRTVGHCWACVLFIFRVNCYCELVHASGVWIRRALSSSMFNVVPEFSQKADWNTP